MTAKIDRNQEPIILSKALLDTLLKQKNPADMIALYVFYYQTAKWQGTNQVKCTTGYTAKGLNWGVEKTRKIKKQLIDIELVEDIKSKNEETGKITGWYIKVNFIWTQKKVEDIQENMTENPQGGKTHRVVKQGTNALSSGNVNASSYDNINALEQTPESIRTEKLPITNSNSPTNRFAHLTGTLLEDEDYNWIVANAVSKGGLGDAERIYSERLDELLENKKFADTWQEFIVYRKKEKKAKLTRRAERQFLGNLLGDFMSDTKITFAVEYIMGSGWQSYQKYYFEKVKFPEIKQVGNIFDTEEDMNKKLEKFNNSIN